MDVENAMFIYKGKYMKCVLDCRADQDLSIGPTLVFSLNAIKSYIRFLNEYIRTVLHLDP